MLLAIDVGNTNIVIGAYRGADLVSHWRVRTDRERTADEHGMLVKDLLEYAGIGMEAIRGIAICSVVPPMMPALLGLSRKYFGVEPLVVDADPEKLGIEIRYEPPSDVGADRLVNAIAAYRLYGGPGIVVDFGTATTFDAISAEGAYLGGAIAPGIGISTEALFRAAARLPRIDLIKPRSVIGRNTVESMQSGILYGFAGQVDEMVRRFRGELGAEAKVIATGGLAELIAREAVSIQIVNPLLTIEGLRMVWEQNRS